MSSTGVISSISTDALVPLVQSSSEYFMLDVREPDEVQEWFIPGVHNIPLGELALRVGEVPSDKKLIVICAKGARALQGAQILSDNGLSSAVLEGGMGAWASTYDQVEENFAGATVIQVRRRGKGCLSYIVGAGTSAVVIDPSLNTALYQGIAKSHGWTVTYIVDTHLHADHISGGRELRSRTGAKLLLSPHDPFSFEFDPLSDGQQLELAEGVSLDVSAVSVPGHTEGSTMYKLGNSAVFTGDTLFLESVGRPDLAEQAESFAHNLFQSLHERILPLPDEVMIFPAHFGQEVEVRSGEFVAKKLGELRHKLPALAMNEADFVAWAISSVKDRPPNYQEIVRINAGQKAVSPEGVEMELGPNRCAIA